MQISSQKVWIGLLIATIVSFASMGLSTYSVTRNLKTVPSITSTSISLGQKFNWTVAEVVEIRGNLYVYLGYAHPSHHFARWQNGWMELSYYYLDNYYLPRNFTLTPYILQVFTIVTDSYLVAQFLES